MFWKALQTGTFFYHFLLHEYTNIHFLNQLSTAVTKCLGNQWVSTHSGNCKYCIIKSSFSIQWNLVITRSLGPWTRHYLVISSFSLYQGKKQRNIKSWDQQIYLVIRVFFVITDLDYNEVTLYQTTRWWWWWWWETWRIYRDSVGEPKGQSWSTFKTGVNQAETIFPLCLWFKGTIIFLYLHWQYGSAKSINVQNQ